MKRCKHLWSMIYLSGNAVVYRCDGCLELQSLGPSDDDKPEVQIEIRAAEIAAEGPTGWRNTSELIGMLLGTNPFDREEPPSDDDQHAGYLARIIYDHDRAQLDVDMEA